MTQPRLLSSPALRALLGACCLLTAIGAQAQSTTTPDMRDQAAVPNRSTDSNVPPATAAKQAREMAQGDPARWYREDPSAAAAVRRLEKEIGAALQEAQGACRKLQASSRAACLSEARATYKRDMADAKAQAYAQRS